MNTPLPLNTGATIPAVGLGTWQSKTGEVKSAVLHAIEAGYRHVDCAFIYRNETEVGEAFKEAFTKGLVKREDIFVTSKLWSTFHSRVEQNLDMSLKNLGLDYVDLYLMHWPVALNPNGNNPYFPSLPDGTRDVDTSRSFIDTYKLMEALPSTGKARAIGVANFSKAYLEKLLSQVSTVPAVNQIENHPLLPQQEIIDFCKGKGIHVTAYSPFGSTGSPFFKDEAVQKVAEKHQVGSGTVLLSYHIARGSSVLPKSVTPSRIDENRKIIELDDEDMKALASISETKGIKRMVFPAFKSSMGFPDKQ